MNPAQTGTPSLNCTPQNSGNVSWPRRAVFALLNRLRTGQLTLVDGNRIWNFGKSGTDGPSAVVHLHDEAAFAEVLAGGSVGAGESYMAGHWSSPDLVAVIRLFARNMAVLEAMSSNSAWHRRIALRLIQAFRRNTQRGSRRNIAAHYDLGNDFFRLFLDSDHMMYSANIWPSADASLEQAANHRLQRICEKLDLSADDHLLEIGSGWGGMAVFAARHFGCRVTTTTISSEQYQYAIAQVASAGLQDRVTVLQQDYRELDGHFDKLVSIEMIEAVGHRYFDTFFRQCSHLLKPEGLMLLQAITIGDQRYHRARRSVDFIQRYIFPGGALPSLEILSRAVARHTDMVMTHVEDIGTHYAKTLAEWRRRFSAAEAEVQAMGFDERFCRMWNYYLCYCEGGFLERSIGTAQIVLAKPMNRAPVPGLVRV